MTFLFKHYGGFGGGQIAVYLTFIEQLSVVWI